MSDARSSCCRVACPLFSRRGRLGLADDLAGKEFQPECYRFTGERRFVDDHFGFPRQRVAGDRASQGIETVACDLLDRWRLEELPRAPNVLFLAAMKFGSTGNEPATWAMNTYLPGMVAETFRESRIVAYSTGNVYAMTPAGAGGRSTLHDRCLQGASFRKRAAK